MAMFGGLQKELGEERFHKVINLLMRGEPAKRLARTLQQLPPKGWGLFQNSSEHALNQQLIRLRKAAGEGSFGIRIAKQIAQGHTAQIRALEHVSIRALDRLEEMSEWHRDRVMAMLAKEKAISFASVDGSNVATIAMKEYRELLILLQKMRFDLGLDEWKGPVQQTGHIKAMSQSVTLPDGTSIQKQIYEAITTIEEIFDAREIPKQVQ